MSPTEDGYINTCWDEDGNEISKERYRQVVRSGQTVSIRVPLDSPPEVDFTLDHGFYALAHMMDVVAREKISAYRQPVKGEIGALPTEAYRVIINNVEDVATYRACMVSLTPHFPPPTIEPAVTSSIQSVADPRSTGHLPPLPRPLPFQFPARQ